MYLGIQMLFSYRNLLEFNLPLNRRVFFTSRVLLLKKPYFYINILVVFIFNFMYINQN